MSNSLKVRGKLVYPSFNKPNKFGKFAVDLVVDAEEQAKLEAVGLAPAKNREGVAKSHDNLGFDGAVFRFSRTPSDKFKSVPVVDVNEVQITDFVGNGTEAELEVSAYPYTQFGGGVAGVLHKVHVINLIKYEKKEATNSGRSELPQAGGNDLF